MIINRAQWNLLMYTGAADVFGLDYDTWPAEHKRFYTKFDSSKAQEVFIEMGGLSYAQIVEEGAAAGGSTITQKYVTNMVNQTVEQNFTMSMEVSQDNQYPDAVPKRIEGLRSSLVATQNEFAFALFNTGFSPNYPIADGRALFANNHPTNGANVSNIVTAVDVSELSLQLGYIVSQSMLEPSGLKLQTKPDALMGSHFVSPTLARLINSTYSPSSNLNAINVANYETWFPGGIITSHYLDAVPNSAFLLMKDIKSFMHIMRQKVEYSIHTNPDTRAIKMAAWERYAFGAKDFRGAVAIQAT